MSVEIDRSELVLGPGAPHALLMLGAEVSTSLLSVSKPSATRR